MAKADFVVVHGTTVNEIATFNSTTDASSTTVAALTVAGGVGIAKNLIVGTTISGTQLTSTVSTGTAPFVVTSTTPVANLSIGGSAGSVTTNANLTGVITSVGNATSIASQTGTGSKFVVDTSPSLITPTIGVATATSINKVAITAPATNATITIADQKTLTINNSISLYGTDSIAITLPATTGTVALNNQTMYLGTTAVAINRISAAGLTLNGVNIDGSAGSVTTNANMTGPITGTGNVTSITSQTGTGTKFVMDTSPSLITPALGVATATSINKVSISTPTTSATITIADQKTLTVNNTLTFNGTDTASVAFGAGGTVVYALGGLSQFSSASTTSTQLATVISDETGSGKLVFGTSPTITTSLVTDSTSFDLINTTATSVNFAKTATALSIGATTGTTTINNDLIVTGELTINGTTTTVNSTILTVDDKNIELGSVTTPTNVTADGGGITLLGATNKSIIWDSTNSNWTSSEHWNLVTNKTYKINNVSVLAASSNTNVTVGGSASTLKIGAVGNGSVTVNTTTFIVGGGYESSTAPAAVQIGTGRTGDGPAWVDLTSDNVYWNYGTRFIRAAGENGLTTITAHGTGGLLFETAEAGSIQFNTTATARMTINSSGNIGIGNTPVTGATLSIRKNITGAVNSYGLLNYAQIQSDVTTNANMFQSQPSTQATAFTLSNLRHFYANQDTFGASSIVTNQTGFSVESTLVGAVNNFGFYGGLNYSAGTTRYNLYMGGSAPNYLAGRLGIGVAPATAVGVYVAQTTTDSSAYGILNSQTASAATTTALRGFQSSINTAASAFTLGSLSHYYAVQGSFGAGSIVSYQIGFEVSDNLTGAANNFGFYGGIAAGANRYNLYMGGTADNYLAGKLLIGTTTAYTVGVSSSLQVHGTGANAYINSTRWSTDVSPSGYIFGKSRGAAVGTRGAVATNDVIGETSYYGDDGTNFVYAASITGGVDSTVSTGVVPGRLMFTTASATGVASERMRITSAGTILVGTTTDDTNYNLVVNGKIKANGFAVGYLDIPQSSQSANYSTALTDAGKHLFHPVADTTIRTFTIDNTLAYPLGTVLTFINEGGANLAITIAAGTLTTAGSTNTTIPKTLIANGIATAIKITSTKWLISGSGLS